MSVEMLSHGPSGICDALSKLERAWRAPKWRTADLWADNCRTLPTGSPYPGAWTTDRTPYLREPMRAFARHDIETVVVLLASQMGKTELGFNVLGWMWDTFPAPALWVCPTQKLAYTISRDRLNSMFESVEGLWDRLHPSYRKPGSLERWIDGVRFGLAWAGSATELASHPCKYVIVDERSRMGDDTGGEGDPVRLAAARTKMFRGAKVGIFSSPGEEGLCPTYRWWLTGSRMCWCWRCPDCGEWLFPRREHAGYPEGASYETIRAEAWIECPECKRRMRDEQRDGLEADYIPSVVDEAGNLTLSPGLETRNSVASFWATGFSAPTMGIGGVMEQIARASRDGEHEDVRAAVNTQAGELYRIPGEGTSAEDVLECQSPEIPSEGIALVTIGADVQQDSIWYTVRGWCPGVTSYLLDYGELHGSTEYDDVYLALAAVAEETYCGLPVSLGLIDSGYRAAQVYDFCRRHPGRWAPSKGVDRLEKPYRASKVDVTATGRTVASLKLWSFSADYWKVWLYGRIGWPKPKVGAWYVPTGIDRDYCQQVTNERFRLTRGRREWYRTGTRQNHLLDCEVMAAVAAHIRNIRAIKVPPTRPEAQKSAELPPRPAPERMDRGPNPLTRRTI